jgi:hypothetical protein
MMAVRSKRSIYCRRTYIQIIEQPDNSTYRFIPLTNVQKVALVSAKKYQQISAHRWSGVWFSRGRSWYAVRYEYPENKMRVTIFMHREVMGLTPDDPRTVDHAFHNTLDNREFVDGKENLRIATQREQTFNQRISSKNTSGYKGVSWDKGTKKWFAYINAHGERHKLGYFLDKEEAYRVRCTAALKLHGKFACFG